MNLGNKNFTTKTEEFTEYFCFCERLSCSSVCQFTMNINNASSQFIQIVAKIKRSPEEKEEKVSIFSCSKSTLFPFSKWRKMNWMSRCFSHVLIYWILNMLSMEKVNIFEASKSSQHVLFFSQTTLLIVYSSDSLPPHFDVKPIIDRFLSRLDYLLLWLIKRDLSLGVFFFYDSFIYETINRKRMR